MLSWCRRWHGGALLGALLSWSGCGDAGDDGGDCMVGSHGCPCAPDGGCLVGLLCQGGVCLPSGGDGGSADGDGSGDSGDSGGGETAGGDPGGPMVQSFMVSPEVIGENDGATFTALVTDPDGLDDLVGGTLTGEGGSPQYGAFVQIGGGTFELVTIWDEISAQQPIEFEGDGTTRVFRADFFDNAGNSGWATVELGFTCEGRPACAGQCMDPEDFESDENCGSCGNACELQTVSYQGMDYEIGNCAEGQCGGLLGECLPADPPTWASCNAYCQSVGTACFFRDCGFATTLIEFGNLGQCEGLVATVGNAAACEEQPPTLGAGEYIRCCCTQ